LCLRYMVNEAGLASVVIHVGSPAPGNAP